MIPVIYIAGRLVSVFFPWVENCEIFVADNLLHYVCVWCDVCQCAGFPPIPVESAAVKPAATVSGSSAPAAAPSSAAPSSAATGGGGVPPKVSPRPQLQKQSKLVAFCNSTTSRHELT